MTRLTPDDAREAEIRRFLVNYEPHSDLPFIVGRLDAARAERVGQPTRFTPAREVEQIEIERMADALIDDQGYCYIVDDKGGTRPAVEARAELVAAARLLRKLSADIAAAQARAAAAEDELATCGLCEYEFGDGVQARGRRRQVICARCYPTPDLDAVRAERDEEHALLAVSQATVSRLGADLAAAQAKFEQAAERYESAEAKAIQLAHDLTACRVELDRFRRAFVLPPPEGSDLAAAQARLAEQDQTITRLELANYDEIVGQLEAAVARLSDACSLETQRAEQAEIRLAEVTWGRDRLAEVQRIYINNDTRSGHEWNIAERLVKAEATLAAIRALAHKWQLFDTTNPCESSDCADVVLALLDAPPSPEKG
ncbi:MAG TPA: hypothetical protein VN903_17625 [Polyangia bacterium]|nr:hypothetical protein [Polyangia bacterium]